MIVISGNTDVYQELLSVEGKQNEKYEI